MTFLLGIIAVIVIAINLSGHSKRLKKVEDEMKSLMAQKSVSTVIANIPQQVNPVLASTSSVNQLIPSVQPSSTAQSIPATQPIATSLNTNVKPVSTVSAEETSGRILGRIGIAAVILGISFFLKYAFDNNWIGPSGRVMIGIIIGIILLAVGQYLRRKYVGYSDLLMGGGIAVMYLSIYSAYVFYSLISPLTAGVFMFIVTALSFAISIADATMTLAMVGVIGGFATPFMVNSGNNSMMELFVYLTILNLGILAVSFFKKWPILIVVAFVGNAINFLGWFGEYYKANMLGPTLVFCFISFLIFLVAAVARATTGKGIADQANYFLLGGNAFAMAVIGYILLEPRYDGILGFAAVLIAVIYMAVAFMVNKANPGDKALNIFLPGLAVVFLSVAVPLQFSGSWIAVAWLVESLFLYVIASVISNRGFQVMGVIVYALGLFNLFFFNYPNGDPSRFVAFFNSYFITVILATIIAYAIVYMYYKFGSLSTEIQKRGIMVFVIIANILTVYAFSSQIIFYHDAKLSGLELSYRQEESNAVKYNTDYDNSMVREEARVKYYSSRESIANSSHTYVSIFWVLYAAVLTAIGFGRRLMTARRLGLALFAVTACKVVIDVWSLGQIYRIISFIVFGIVALGASFFYVKFKDRLSDIV